MFKHNPNSEYYKRAKRQIEALIGNPDFDFDMRMLMKYKRDDLLSEIETKYQVLPSALPVLFNYYQDLSNNIKSKPKYESIEPPVTVFSQNSRVYLELSPDITNPELQDFVRKHYKELIKPNLIQNSKRITNKKHQLGKYEQSNKVLQLQLLGYSRPEIAKKLGLDYPTVRAIIVNKRRTKINYFKYKK